MRNRLKKVMSSVRFVMITPRRPQASAAIVVTSLCAKSASFTTCIYAYQKVNEHEILELAKYKKGRLKMKCFSSKMSSTHSK